MRLRGRVPTTCSDVAERRDLTDGRHRRCSIRARKPLRVPVPSTTKVDEAGRLATTSGDRAADDQQLAVGNIVDAVTAFGLVHVMGRDQHRQPVGGARMDLVPELAPRFRIDPGRRLVEQQQLGLVHDAGCQRQPLLPAARQRPRHLPPPREEPEILQRVADMPARRPHAVEPGDKGQVLLDRQILVEREFLRHVADFALDLQRLGADVVAEHAALAAVGRQKPAHHPDRRCLSGPVRTQEPGDLAGGDIHRDMVDDGLVAERLHQAADLDRIHRPACPCAASGSCASTICPGFSPADAASGRASISQTSFCRLSSE